jgi:hypothetical protein
MPSAFQARPGVLAVEHCGAVVEVEGFFEVLGIE